MEEPESYEPPAVEEVGEFAELTRGHRHGTLFDFPGAPFNLFDPRESG
ncbi:lasso RiPP family leader peptide-containing protein [Streptomyces sp. NPDC046215]|uniref:Lasso RiPP family leader peptide-containing protein n=1 Tax=Streptomyces stramineus TaxID=173861 RepID=A0ABP3L0X6_9ACTN